MNKWLQMCFFLFCFCFSNCLWFVTERKLFYIINLMQCFFFGILHKYMIEPIGAGGGDPLVPAGGGSVIAMGSDSESDEKASELGNKTDVGVEEPNVLKHTKIERDRIQVNPANEDTYDQAEMDRSEKEKSRSNEEEVSGIFPKEDVPGAESEDDDTSNGDEDIAAEARQVPTRAHGLPPPVPREAIPGTGKVMEAEAEAGGMNDMDDDESKKMDEDMEDPAHGGRGGSSIGSDGGARDDCMFAF